TSFDAWTTVGVPSICLTVVLLTAWFSLGRYGRFAYANLALDQMKLWQDLWLPSAQVGLSRKLGVLEYLAFSSQAETVTIQPLITSEPGPSVDEMKVAAGRFLTSPVDATRKLPNIVFLHAESTFDPNTAFKLSVPVVLPLWSKLAETRALGPLRVNIIGGGSW